MEKFNELLNCTPNALSDWREDGKTVVHHTHTLRTLIKKPADIQTTLRKLPLDKMEMRGDGRLTLVFGVTDLLLQKP